MDEIEERFVKLYGIIDRLWDTKDFDIADEAYEYVIKAHDYVSKGDDENVIKMLDKAEEILKKADLTNAISPP